MKVSIVITVLNEQNSTSHLLQSLLLQTKKPNEIIIVDGGSSDKTVAELKTQKAKLKSKIKNLRILIKPGNRAVGRNFGIESAKNEFIAITDAGCILDKHWLANITKPFKDESVDVVAGYYRGLPENIFEKCLVPYVLVMPDRIEPEKFLPASRSLAFKKSIWEKVGGFPENYSYNEDYIFAKKLKKIGVKIVFVKDAVVGWMPRKNIVEAFMMFFKFALGDAQARIFRPKMLLILLRYFVGLVLLLIFLKTYSYLILHTLYLLLMFYISWAIIKNYKYVRHWQAFVFLPLLQFTSDLAVISGTISGLFYETD